ncbi:MAG: translation initiation factor IF-3, partial [Prevotella sp.]|nr:translation initiation factor IF-3 [Prevotella sp.]MBR6494308.1 translation initiation factor IF-3 [Prevotella sp.]
FLFLAPKKAGVAKKSQQKRDNERREAEAKAIAIQEAENNAAVNGLLANAKGGEELLKMKSEE